MFPSFGTGSRSDPSPQDRWRPSNLPKVMLHCPRCGNATLQVANAPGVQFVCSTCGNIGIDELTPQLAKFAPDKKQSVLDEHPEFARLIGQLAATSSWTEHYLCLIAGFLLRSPPWHTRTAFYAVVNNKARIDMVRALATHMLGANEFAERLNKLLDDAGRLASRRNSYIHGLWETSKDGADLFIVENVGSPSGSTPRKVRTDELEDILEKTKALLAAMSVFTGDYSEKFPLQIPPPEQSVPDALRRKFGLLPPDRSPDSDGSD